VLPGQVAGEGGEEVEEDVGDDHVVVDGHQAYDEQHGRAGTFEEGADFPDGQGSQAGELAQRELEEEEGDAADGQHEEVGHEEGASSVGVGPVGETPDIAQAHTVANAGQQEIQLACPVPPVSGEIHVQVYITLVTGGHQQVWGNGLALVSSLELLHLGGRVAGASRLGFP